MNSPKRRLSFNKMSDTEFEEFAYDLLEELGFVNLDWRKGTGKKTSPSDSGRDIVAYLPGSCAFQEMAGTCMPVGSGTGR
jgi:HJR/Mrr/RecB family endonuclease